ncbi:MAG TPA: response regulator transcription factor [Flavobacteriales bacterium]|nr:response regulator transcription factor [Flavobacteriales bacterium]HNE79373.1 response regulator transcription factor [Flavobacteriales bacterium]HNI03908.1 response regulator transcription factor [Flavobacteriales bacterium]HNO04090.1 response regulator transcription factor [Flavobacteriales bacterium]
MDTPIKLLVCEDDPNLGSLLAQYLLAKGFVVEHRKDGEQGWAAYAEGGFDLLLLDVMMPKLDGFSLARRIREKDARTPIIFLTAKSMKQDTITGFQAGADDYLTKPFSMEELILRINAVLKRARGLAPKEEEPTRYALGSFVFDLRKQTLARDTSQSSLFPGEEHDVTLTEVEANRKLTTKETELLRMLCMHRNALLPRETALKEVWGDDNYFNGRSMDVYIAKLRKYLAPDPRVEIINVHGKGFRLVTREEE